MSAIVSNSIRNRGMDHFEPEAALDPQQQRKMRGHLEQIDYTAYAANLEIVGKTLGGVDLGKFQRVAIAAAHARAKWVAAAMAMTEQTPTLSPDQVAQLALCRKAYEELTEAYETMRRMVERGYLAYQPGA
jgi:hypothetical protein